MRVCVIGAGPTGLTAAVELQRQGVAVTLLEKRDAPSTLSRAVGISKRSMEIFAPSGVADAISHEAIRFKSIRFHDHARPVVELPLNFDDETRIWGLAQDRTEHHLLAAFRRLGGEPRFATACTGLSQSGDAVRVETTAGPLEVDHVIGCDGVRSTVRSLLGLDFPGFDLPKPWSIADVDADDWPDPETFKGYLIDDGDVAVVVPLAKGRYRVIASRPDALEALPVIMNVTRVHRTGTFQISVRQVRQYAVGRVLLAGDAAHCHSPVGGRGMNLGIADAADAAERIMAGDVSGYHAARHAAGQDVIAFSERGRKILQSQFPLARFGITSAMRLVGAVPPLRRFAVRRFVSG